MKIEFFKFEIALFSHLLLVIDFDLVSLCLIYNFLESILKCSQFNEKFFKNSKRNIFSSTKNKPLMYDFCNVFYLIVLLVLAGSIKGSVEDIFVSCLHKHLGTGKWIFNYTFVYPFLALSSHRTGSGGSCSFVLKAKTRWQLQFVLETFNTSSEFWVITRGIAYTNIAHNVISFSLC